MPYRPPDQSSSFAHFGCWAPFDHGRAREEMHSRSSSSQTDATETSPISSVFGESARHSRIPSSNSSLSSSPTLYDSNDGFASTRKTQLEGLPEVDEDRAERDLRPDHPRVAGHFRELYNGDRWSQDRHEMFPANYFGDAYDNDERRDRDDFYADSDDGHWAKRRRSGDFAWNSFAAGIASRISSISRASRDKKRASAAVIGSRYRDSVSPPTSTPTLLSRSSSMRRSLSRRSLDRDAEPKDAPQAHANIETIIEDDFHELVAPSPIYNLPEDETPLPFPPQNEARSTTPILPPLMDTQPPPHLVQSPLQSPTVATDNAGPASSSHTPDGTPQLSGVASPALSTKPSVASMHRAWPSTIVQPTNEIPPLIMADPNDEWAEKLGHANFQITPEPYVPEVCDQESCHNLIKDWETARSEYSKHLARTEMHFGRSSRTLRLTEEKWASVDAQWKQSNDLALRRAVLSGLLHKPSPKGPAPVAKIPPIDDPRLIQSDEIPGPMTIEEPAKQFSSQLQRRRSKRAQFLKIFGNLQLPSPALGRSAAAAAVR